MQIVNIDGRLFPPDQARISVYDHGFLYGDNVYETMRTYRRRVFVVERHMQRLQNSARMLMLKLPLSNEEMIREITRTVDATDNPECYVRLIVTR
jgi:branched-chain amino acid aminotransferase